MSKKVEPRISKSEARRLKESTWELAVPFGLVDWQEQGNISVERSGIRLNLNYEPSDLGNDWRKLTGLSLETDQDPKRSSSLLSEVQPDTYISFKIKDFSDEGKMRTDGKELRLSENILTPKGLIIFLHEVGHDLYERGKEKTGKNQPAASFFELLLASKLSNMEKLAESLRTERSADAYALGKLRPFIDQQGLPKHAVLAFIHSSNLQKYSSYLRGATEGPIRSILKDISTALQGLLSKTPESSI